MTGTDMDIDKRDLSERDVCTKFITPALRDAGWDEMHQLREEVTFTKGRIIVRGKRVTRGQSKRADYILYYRPNIPIALIEAKANWHGIGTEMFANQNTAAAPRTPKWRTTSRRAVEGGVSGVGRRVADTVAHLPPHASFSGRVRCEQRRIRAIILFLNTVFSQGGWASSHGDQCRAGEPVRPV